MSSSGSSFRVVPDVRDRVPYLRQISFFFPLPAVLSSGFRSHARGILFRGSDLGSRKAASVSSHVCANDDAFLRGDGAMAAMSEVDAGEM